MWKDSNHLNFAEHFLFFNFSTKINKSACVYIPIWCFCFIVSVTTSPIHEGVLLDFLKAIIIPIICLAPGIDC